MFSPPRVRVWRKLGFLLLASPGQTCIRFRIEPNRTKKRTTSLERKKLGLSQRKHVDEVLDYAQAFLGDDALRMELHSLHNNQPRQQSASIWQHCMDCEHGGDSSKSSSTDLHEWILFMPHTHYCAVLSPCCHFQVLRNCLPSQDQAVIACCLEWTAPMIALLLSSGAGNKPASVTLTTQGIKVCVAILTHLGKPLSKPSSL